MENCMHTQLQAFLRWNGFIKNLFGFDLILWLTWICIKYKNIQTYTVWHENLTAIKFYGLSKLLKQKKLNFTVIEAT